MDDVEDHHGCYWGGRDDLDLDLAGFVDSGFGSALSFISFFSFFFKLFFTNHDFYMHLLYPDTYTTDRLLLRLLP